MTTKSVLVIKHQDQNYCLDVVPTEFYTAPIFGGLCSASTHSGDSDDFLTSECFSKGHKVPLVEQRNSDFSLNQGGHSQKPCARDDRYKRILSGLKNECANKNKQVTHEVLAFTAN
jgi:hypothetical protein